MNDTIYVAQKSLQEIRELNSSFSIKDCVFIIIALSNIVILYYTLKHIKNSPIKAVQVADDLQTNRSNSDRLYNNKFNVFATILGLRHCKALNEQFVIAINQIPIVFHDNKEIMGKLDRFIKTHIDTISPIDTVMQNLNSDLNDLVISIAQDLGYSNVDNNLMKTFYNPDASYFRNQSDSIYNEIYWRENSTKLDVLQGNEIVKSNDKQVTK